MANRNNRYDENEETRLFNVTGNFWVDALIIAIVPWLLVGLESNKRLKFSWWKACLVGLVALLLANFSFGNLFSSDEDEYKTKYKNTLGKYEKLEAKFNDYESKVSEYKSKVDKLEAEKDDKKVVVKETEKVTPKPTKKPTQKPTKKHVEKKKVSTMANKARAKLKGRVDLPYLDAINILISIDALVDPINEEKISVSYYEYVWIQTFKFSDGSKIRVSKYQEDSEFIFMAILAN